MRFFATPWTAACQASLSITNSQSLLKLMSIESVMSPNQLILCHPLLLSSNFPSIRVFSNESVLRIRWPQYWNFSFSISPSSEYWRGLKNTNLLSYSSGGQKFQMDLPGLKSRFKLGCIPSRGSGGNTLPDFFQFLEASFIPWFAAHFSIFKINSKASSNLSLTQDPPTTHTHLPLPLLWKDSCDDTGSIPLIHDNLSILRSAD